MTSGARSDVLIAVDWGTSSCRVWALDVEGSVLDKARSKQGTLAVSKAAKSERAADRAAAFEAALVETAGSILDRYPDAQILACGMVGSTIGWVEAGYRELPAEFAPSRDDLAHVSMSDGRAVWIVPGLRVTARDEGSWPDVIRGEETQLVGVLASIPREDSQNGTRTIVLPGTHTKWVRTRGDEIETFATVMSGEIFNVMMSHSILGAPAQQSDGFDRAAFTRGLKIGREQGRGSLAARLFAARTLLLDGQVPPDAVGDLLSGILIADEIAGQPDLPGRVVLCGDGGLVERYREALAHAGIASDEVTEDATRTGLRDIARRAGLMSAHGTSDSSTDTGHGRPA